MRRFWGLVCIAAGAVACNTPGPPASAPDAGQMQSITGDERIAWSQPADDAAQLAALHFAIYVDGNRSEIMDVSCSPRTDSTGTFPCSGKLPDMTDGIHKLEISTFTLRDGRIVESPRSFLMHIRVDGASQLR